MALVLNDRVKETTTTTGQGTISLGGAATGFETFVTGIGDTNTTYYIIAHESDGTWEIGIGTVADASPDTLARTTVIDTSAGNTTKLTTGGRQTAALYRQFRNVILAPNTDEFSFTGAPSSSDDFYFISFQRARQREKIDPGNWELQLTGQMSGKAAKIQLIDDSGAGLNPTVNEGGRVFNVVSGSINDGINTAAASQPGGGLGLFYPDLGIILLDASQMEASGGIADPVNPRSSDTFDNRPQKFYNSIKSGSSFQARREEEISSTNFFIRANNKDFNFSSNPTFSTGSDGSLTQGTFFKDPKTFITQVGLYNDENELLAIAKLSKPLLKSYSREAIIKVKLDF